MDSFNILASWVYSLLDNVCMEYCCMMYTVLTLSAGGGDFDIIWNQCHKNNPIDFELVSHRNLALTGTHTALEAKRILTFGFNLKSLKVPPWSTKKLGFNIKSLRDPPVCLELLLLPCHECFSPEIRPNMSVIKRQRCWCKWMTTGDMMMIKVHKSVRSPSSVSS